MGWILFFTFTAVAITSMYLIFDTVSDKNARAAHLWGKPYAARVNGRSKPRYRPSKDLESTGKFDRYWIYTIQYLPRTGVPKIVQKDDDKLRPRGSALFVWVDSNGKMTLYSPYWSSVDKVLLFIIALCVALVITAAIGLVAPPIWRCSSKHSRGRTLRQHPSSP
jgi:hypothetical protein